MGQRSRQLVVAVPVLSDVPEFPAAPDFAFPPVFPAMPGTPPTESPFATSVTSAVGDRPAALTTRSCICPPATGTSTYSVVVSATALPPTDAGGVVPT